MDTNLILPTVGFREEQPLKCAGILRLPPISGERICLNK
jgi:hypothetical protein